MLFFNQKYSFIIVIYQITIKLNQIIVIQIKLIIFKVLHKLIHYLRIINNYGQKLLIFNYK